jgi:hypothetical protein
MPKSEPNISALIENFTNQIVAAVNAAAAERIQAALAGAFELPQARAVGRPAKSALVLHAVPAGAKRSRPKQLCPVPGCNNVAAPVFGMVCSDHKGVAKSKIAKYRAERKADAGRADAGSSVGAKAVAPKTKKKLSPKMAQARKLQGQYLGALRGLNDANRAKVRQLAAEGGVADAVKLALSLKKASK